MAITSEWIATRLREIREDAGLSQTELGDRLGKYQAWIHRRESGLSKATFDDVTEWAKACGRTFMVDFPEPSSESDRFSQMVELLRKAWPYMNNDRVLSITALLKVFMASGEHQDDSEVA
ncbi:MAG: helix-turn-helix domain-containing protein [Myxococcota bacterium]